MCKIESCRTITAMVRTKISTEGLDPYFVEVLPDVASIAATRNETNWISGNNDSVTLYDGNGEKILEMLPDEASDVAMGLLHALCVAGYLVPIAIEKQFSSWSGQEWNGTTDEGIFLADGKNSNEKPNTNNTETQP
jgi:hypothetical protein